MNHSTGAPDPANPSGSGSDPNQRLTHVNSQGDAQMVNVADKPITARHATAASRIAMSIAAAEAIRRHSLAKGDALPVARIAAIQAVKQTSLLIPLCHAISIDGVDTEHEWVDPQILEWRVTVRSTGKTGVEMEALTAATVAALTIYDMCKAIDRTMEIQSVRLLEKFGGQRGDFRRIE
ncbi:MAG: cyclic pyranopterin monophosphate synthase MoaC [Planctomycetota bacterium]